MGRVLQFDLELKRLTDVVHHETICAFLDDTVHSTYSEMVWFLVDYGVVELLAHWADKIVIHYLFKDQALPPLYRTYLQMNQKRV